ncbi:MAG: 16S rRNA processing protein RimM [Gammaproteobacteria bacterium]|nr:16S rRNA processing protein RimM [Gammaproteobacteria bacterium]
MSDRRVTLGRIVGVFGVKGWVKVQSYTRPTDNLLRYRRWQLGGTESELEEGRVHGPGLAVKLKGVEDRDTAARLMGLDIAVARDELPKPRKGEIYWVDLMGCRVVSQGGAELGEIVGVTDNGAQDVMLVKGEVDRLIPFVAGPIVKKVDLKTRRVVVDWEPDY